MPKQPRTPAVLAAAFALIGMARCLAAPAALGGPDAGQGNKPLYVFAADDLHRGLVVPVKDRPVMVTFSDSMIKDRTQGAVREPIIEAMQLPVPVDAAARRALVGSLALPGRERRLWRYFERKIIQGHTNAANAPNAPTLPNAANNAGASSSVVLVTIDPSALGLIDLEALARRFSRGHHHLTVPTAALAGHEALRRALIGQLQPFFTDEELERVSQGIRTSPTLDVDRDLLPQFARRVVRHFTKFRGPNCFHAALAFQDAELPASPEVNVKLEKGYHPMMINNDELWWELNREFVEVDARSDHLRYGDILVFLDVADPVKPVDFHWIKHATTYLFNDYVFSKGSNSPNTPYTVKTLAEEWSTWAKSTSRLGVKVFRRARR